MVRVSGSWLIAVNAALVNLIAFTACSLFTPVCRRRRRSWSRNRPRRFAFKGVVRRPLDEHSALVVPKTNTFLPSTSTGDSPFVRMCSCIADYITRVFLSSNEVVIHGIVAYFNPDKKHVNASEYLLNSQAVCCWYNWYR